MSCKIVNNLYVIPVKLRHLQSWKFASIIIDMDTILLLK